MKKKRLLIFSFLLVFILPLGGSYLKWGGYPPGYGFFPAQKAEADPPFNQTIFNIYSAVALFILLFLIYPKLFGFKKAPDQLQAERKIVKYPPWFLPAIIVLLISWFFMWSRLEIVKPLDHFTFVPLWWSFILVLDGVVYKRNNGISLVSSRPVTLKLLAVTSSFSWFVFEYLNFFVIENWYYPNNHVFTNFGNISWQLLSYTTVLPAIFEWYWLLRTFKPLRERYAFGPKITFSRAKLYILLVVGLILTVLMGYFPYALFWMLWVSLVPSLVPAMALSNYWTPLTPIGEKGDWSLVILIAFATLFNGFFWEFWNFGSEWLHSGPPTNPNYWKYSVPYVDKYHIFSQMPVLGYFGYLFFGNVCWILWVTMAYLFDFDPSIHQQDNTVNDTAIAVEN